MSMNSIQSEIAFLEGRLRELRDAEKAAVEARKASVTPVWRFTIEPDKSRYDRIWDDTIVLYRLTGKIVNKAECEAVGADVGSEGSMCYLFNTSNARLVMAHGGGNVFISDGSWSFSNRDKTKVEESFRKVTAALGAFLDMNPAGGDVTEMIETHRAEINAA